ncbi:hypothetical protein BGZ63DRAFT_410721 [Mariannaea sp. PMI_226]|nr:hypothetical protein BGZ63DRAFT_410721 [Mariannaea sp. PMI_226]
MSEEPSLPRLPGVSWDEKSQSFSNNPRKRVRYPPGTSNAPSLKYNSSDPAVFSSDDDPALDNYVEGRRKKRYVGSWFQQQPASSDSTFGDTLHVPKQRRQRQWTRQADSGVFLGSDGDESDDVMEHLAIPPKPRLQLAKRSPLRSVSRAEQLVRDKVRACLDLGEETVDFWSMGLEEVSNDAISLLSQFSCIPVVAKDVAFQQKDPELKIYLAMNRLTRVPGAIFDLNYLTILSLRGNKLTELPPAISKLHNLTELNVSQNRLRHLPIELLDLFRSENRLNTLVVHPNPFWQPERGSEDSILVESEANPANTILRLAGEDARGIPIPHLISRSLGRSPVQLSNTGGRFFSEFSFPSDYRRRILSVETRTDESSEVTRRSLANATRVPSLVEVALRACYRSTQLPEMANYMPDGLGHLRRLLERATEQKETGGLMCSSCRKSIVVPTTEWVEWKEIRTCKPAPSLSPLDPVRVAPLSMAEGETAVPFIHRGCSWRCRPSTAGLGDWEIPEGFPASLHVIAT